MISVTIKGLSLLKFVNLNRFPEILHFSTTRSGGSSKANYSSLNLGLNSGDNPENVFANREMLCNILEIKPEQLILPKQTHSATVKVIRDEFLTLSDEFKKRFLQETDAILTDLRGVCITIKTADCVPLLLFDPKHKVIAAIHAGWRGTSQNIVVETIQKMVEEFGSSPADLIAGIGPSISPAVYEVGADVHSQFDPVFYRDTYPVRKDKKLLNLWEANRQQLLRAGVPTGQIELAQICTLSDPERFFSARRDGAKTGRMGTGIMLK
jgi:polyphenol oxidase